ncbi:MAG: L,D-transpeptidase family protein [Flavobacteriales bacterium]|nr:L,D-transpeptidase family protein [Flavobacteriales bacterium]
MRIPFTPLVILTLLAGCNSIQEEEKDATVQEINEVFESRVVYSVRTLTPGDLDAYLTAHPVSHWDSTAITDFYTRRNFQYAWFVNDTLSQAAAGFLALVNSSDIAYRELEALRDSLNDLLRPAQQTPTDTTACDGCRTALELALTSHFFRFADKKYGGVVGKDLHELDWFIPRKKKNYDRLLDSLAAGGMDLRSIEPLHPQYAALKDQLKQYVTLDTLVGWEPILLGERKKILVGDTAQIIPEIRQRLILLGDLITGMDMLVLSSTVYDSTLMHAVVRFQDRHGLEPDGQIGKGMVRMLNFTPAQRVRTMLINMERLRWVPEQYAPNQLLVNIPEYRLHIYENGVEAWNMKVVVGAEATRTVIFSDTLSRIVFSPYWGVPNSIVRNEILPALKKDPNYLSKKGMERIGGTDANPLIRQKPGGGNALGRVKFLFPNSYSIYFHDTPSKGGFARESRAFSHGCIRLSQPQELAEYLLRNDTAWTKEKIKEAMYKGKETWVIPPEKRPVSIGYFTAWVDAKGLLNFRDDVYGHDERLANELFYDPTPPVAIVALTPLEAAP